MEQNPAPVVVSCPACGLESTGRFCCNCREELHPQRFTLKHITDTIPAIVFGIERGLLFTIKELIIHPKVVINNFLRGDRSRYFRPLKLVLLTSGLYAFLYMYFDITSPSSTYEGVADPERARFLDQKYIELQSLINLFSLPFLSLLTWLFFRKKKLYYGEHLVINSYVVGIVVFVYDAVFPFTLMNNGTVWVDRIDQIMILATLYFSSRTYYGVLYLKRSTINYIKAVFLTLCIIIILGIYYIITSPYIIDAMVAVFGK